LLQASAKTSEAKAESAVVKKVAQRSKNAVFKIDELSKRIENIEDEAVELCDTAKVKRQHHVIYTTQMIQK
jgi:hypothetical protein